MERNVMSWNVAIERGYNPSLYTFNAADIPLGEYTAKLEFKIWAKKSWVYPAILFRNKQGKNFS